MTVRIAENKNLAAAMAAAMRSDDVEVQAAAWEQFHAQVVERLMDDFEEIKQSNDSTILVNRGYRQLTTAETKWYQKLAEVMASPNPTQSFAEILGADVEDGLMPETILEDVYRNLQEEHPLLNAVTFTYVKYATKWILNDHTKQKAIWGDITDEITKEISSGFKIVDVNQSKLSAFAFVERGMLDLGPTFLDAYIRAVLQEALLCGLEHGIIAGSGVKEPIGMIRDIHEGVTVNTTTGYPKKTAKQLTSFDPGEYGAVLAELVETESGNMRTFSGVQLIVNMVDYLTKVMPSTTAKTTDGRYVTDLFPFPTEVIVSNEVTTGEAVLGLSPEYTLFVGGDKNGVVEFSDEFKFLGDLRYFKMKQYANGRAFDDTSFILLDISKLEPAYLNVVVTNTVSTKVTDTVTTKEEATTPTV